MIANALGILRLPHVRDSHADPGFCINIYFNFSHWHSMHNTQIYGYSWLALFLCIILYRRILWINRQFRWLNSRFSSFSFIEFINEEYLNLFPPHTNLQLPFLTLILLFNIMVLLLFPNPDWQQTITSRIGEVILINLSVIFLLSLRHSLFMELAAIYQFELLWAHRSLGFLTAAEMIGYVGLKFRGKSSLSLTFTFANQFFFNKIEFRTDWSLLMVGVYIITFADFDIARECRHSWG